MGFDLAAHWCGWSNIFQVEIDPYCNKVLTRHFPHTARHQDIKTFDARPYAGQIDVLSGGWPCQPFSSLGDKKGKDDPRHLWPHMHRVIEQCRPRWVVGENVERLAKCPEFDATCRDLEDLGYTVRAAVVPASAVGAKHIRKRLWIIAHADGGGLTALEPPAVAGELEATRLGRLDPVSVWATPMPPLTRGCGMADGLSRGDERTRRSRLHALGNAIVPQVAYSIFRAIEMFEGGR